MNRTFASLLEITHVEAAQGRIEELDRFLDVTRAFSLRCSGHLRVLASLVNGLLESEDWLELGESELRLPDRRRFGPRVVRLEGGEELQAGAVLGGLRVENERLLRMIEQGEDNTNYLRGLMGQLLDGLAQKEARGSQHECLHLHCCNEGESSADGLANSNLRGGAEEPRLRDICAELLGANRKLEAELERLRQREGAEGQGVAEMLRKVMEVKADCEAQLREKEREAAELRAALAQGEQAQVRAEGELAALRVQLKKLQAAQRPPPAPAAKDKVVLDFLKACYNQASYIEEFIMVAQ